MTPNEQFKKWVYDFSIDNNCSFTDGCALFGRRLEPEVTTTQVWKWASKNVTPGPRFRGQILELTDVRFDRKPVARKKRESEADERETLVKFVDLVWEKATAPCYGCTIDGGSDECENAVYVLTGMNCKSNGFILKRKPVWEICTKQNTKVGDVVRRIGTGCRWTVKYILENDNPEMMVTNFSGVDVCGPMRLFEVEI